jgi:hypothetical protein
MRILIVNHKEKECGVQQYGKRFGRILERSENNKFEYFECSSAQDLSNKINLFWPQIIIYNYLPETMPWFTGVELNSIRNAGIKQGLIVHNIGYATGFDFYLHQHPDYPENGVNYPILRPLFNYKEGKKMMYNIVPHIGSFGFAFKHKKYEDICKLVNDQFDEAVINLHLTISKFFPNHEELEEIKNLCRSAISKEKITINFTSHHAHDHDLLEFLAKNDLNIFLYKHYDNYNGISSVIDYALSVDKPLAICKSNMFSHINKVSPSICVEDLSLIEIIKNGPKVLEPFKLKWSNENFIKNIENVMEKVL